LAGHHITESGRSGTSADAPVTQITARDKRNGAAATD